MSTRAEQISDIINKDRQAFDSWVSNTSNKQKLDILSGALRYFIPPGVYDFAQDPTQVRLIEWNKSRKRIDFYVAEERDKPLSNLELLRYSNFRRHMLINRSGYQLPEGLDFFHFEYPDQVFSGVISPHDFIFNRIILRAYSAGDLHVVSYGDRPELRRKGIGISFYSRLREIALNLGFRFITGEVDPESAQGSNYTFYTKKLGRKRLDELPEHIRELLEDRADNPDRVLTVECLHKEDLWFHKYGHP